ncbi:opioid growth factor receptor-related protein [Vibrio sp. B1Z05]|uniref:opioid growth factor receptor-related protein n=1 Tax=Vibrio sp. B1Z05 TaxID=2654980 RepID=UPI00128E47B1|nr:opioid growth factor receptor-related protein [Vibrio sp. B1Z05]MPW35595.1 hypothetical protein [Vibrio sp. B1Z05]
MNVICQFMLGQQLDHKNRSIEQIWALDDFWLQYDREYLQWLFPIDTSNKLQSHTPLVCQSTRDYFFTCKALREAQRRSLNMMLNFYDMQLIDGVVLPQTDFSVNEHSWLKYDDYSHQCITQMIRSLALLGQKELSQAFQKGMIDAAVQYGEVGQESLTHWRNAHLL